MKLRQLRPKEQSLSKKSLLICLSFYTVVPVEATLILTRVRDSSEKVVVKLLDILKQGLGSLVAKTVVATTLVLFGSARFRSIQGSLGLVV